MIISELSSSEWEFKHFIDRRVGRGQMLVRDYLAERGVEWKFSAEDADYFVYKQVSGNWLRPWGAVNLVAELRKKRNSITVIGEPRAIAPSAYRFARRERALVCAPGDDFPHRLYFPSDWYDPKLESWSARRHEVVFVGRPTDDRVRIVAELEAVGVPVVVYSRAEWPVGRWRGPCEDEFATSQMYKFRLVCENDNRYQYHSDKLFNGIRAGNVTIYACDPRLDVSFAKQAFIRYSPASVQDAYENAGIQRQVLEGVEQFMFSSAWEIYSFREFFNRMLDLCQ